MSTTSRFNTKNYELVENNDINFRTNTMCSNEKYICVEKLLNCQFFSLNMELINSIKIFTIQGLLISENDNIYVPLNDKFNIYNLKEDLLKSWKLDDNYDKDSRCRNISLYKNENYMVDTSFNRICVFFHEEKLIRSSGDYDMQPGNFVVPWEITIYLDIVFVIDLVNYKIQTFTCYGKLIPEYKFTDSIKYKYYNQR